MKDKKYTLEKKESLVKEKDLVFVIDENGENQNIQNGNVEPKAYQVSIFPILPSITWNFNF